MIAKSSQTQINNHPEVKTWHKIGSAREFPLDEGVCIKYKDQQIAVFHFHRKNQWYACQNLCPHRHEMVLSRGILGDESGVPKIACPLHKSAFSLLTGANLNGKVCSLVIYPVKVTSGCVYIGIV